jgi:FkbM family methyltransferase
MFSFVFQCIKNFGFPHGLLIYLNIKLFKSGKFFLPGLIQPIYFRPGTVDVHTFREIFLRNEYDVKLPSLLAPQIIIDAGANIGYTTLFFMKRFPNAKIFSLEPNQENFELLKKNTSGYPNIKPIQAALWDKIGTIEILDKGYGARGFIVEETQGKERSTKVIESMKAITLESLVQEYKLTAIDILKMDIEGSEKEVFSGNYETWLPITKCLIIELHDRMKDGCSQSVFKALSNFEFECSIKGENLVFINRNYLSAL